MTIEHDPNGQAPEASPPEYCPLLVELRCDQVECIELYGMATDTSGAETGVLLARMSPEATAEDVARDFGGGRFELKAIGRSRGGDAPYTKMRGLHLAGEERWKANVAGLEEPAPPNRTGALPGAGGFGFQPPGAPPYGHGGGYGSFGAPPSPGMPGMQGMQGMPQAPGVPVPPGFRPPYPGMAGMGFGSAPYPGFAPGAAAAAAGVVPIPKEGGVAPGLPPQQTQQVIDKELEERRRREDQKELLQAQTNAQMQTMGMVTQMASVFRGDQGSTDQRIMFYQQELARKNSEMDQMRMQFQGMLQAKDQQIFTLQQQLLNGQQGSQSQQLALQQENLTLKGEIQALQMRLQLGSPGGGPSGAVQMVQAVGPAVVDKLFGIPKVAEAIGSIAQKMAGGGGLPGAPASPPLPSGGQ